MESWRRPEIPRLPGSDASNGFNLSSGGVRITTGTNRRLRLFAVTQIAASFVLLTGAGMLITALFALQQQQTGFRVNVLAVNVPVVSYTRKPEEITAFALDQSDDFAAFDIDGRNDDHLANLVKLLKICSPTVWLFSGWNWTPNRLPRWIAEANVFP